MPRNKLRKIQEADSLPNVLVDIPKDKNNWLIEHFGNHNPIVLEIGCGRGDYVLNLGQKHPGINFIGVDVKGARLWTGAKMALSLNVSNVAFLRAQAEDLMDYFTAQSIDEMCITFPEPFPKKRGTNRRVTSPRFLNVYKTILKKSGRVHLKTDDQPFFNYTLDTLSNNAYVNIEMTSADIYKNKLNGDITEIQTKYEKRHLKEGRIIKYVSFSFNGFE